MVGGLKFAGVNGNSTQQGDPPAAKLSPRLGAVYSLNTKTVLRAGYGMYWAPWNYPAPSPNSYGGIGFSNNTSSPQTTVTPTVGLANPFPNGLVKPSGSNLGLLAGAGTNINFVDETRKAPRVQQYTVDLQRELGNDMAITFSYVGARGDNLPLGGTVNTSININQLDTKYLALGSAVLAQTVPNPFFGNPAFAGTALGNQATTTRGQLLRPFPQFGNILMFQTSEGVNRYNAGVVELSKRMSKGWGGRFSYTYSRLKDNQIGETNFYTNPGIGGVVNNYNYVSTLPACDGGLSRVQKYSSMCFDPLVDYDYGILDTPHRFVVAPIVALPFGKDHNIGKSRIGNLFAGGWTVAAVFTWQCGFPIGVTQSNSTSNLLGNDQRPNQVAGVDTDTPGSWPERIASADHPSAAWLNAAAFSAAAAGTFGNAPRSIIEHADADSDPDRRVVREERPVRQRQDGSAQDRDRQPVQPRAAARQPDERNPGQLGLRHDRLAGRVHAVDADDVPLLLLIDTEVRARTRSRSATETETQRKRHFSVSPGLVAFFVAGRLVRSCAVLRPCSKPSPSSSAGFPFPHQVLAQGAAAHSSAASSFFTASSTTTRSRRSARRSGIDPGFAMAYWGEAM